MALTEDKVLKLVVGDNAIPAGADAVVFKGSMVGICADSYPGIGYGEALEAGEVFGGHALEAVDNTDGANGDENIQVRAGRYRLVVDLSGVAVTDVGSDVYASDDETLTLTEGANSFVGVITRYVSSGICEVEFRPFEV